MSLLDRFDRVSSARRWFLIGLGGLAAAALSATPAAALQFSPTGSELLHTVSDGQPGAAWNTSGLGAGGEATYDDVTQRLSLTGVLDVLNWYDPTVGSGCETSATNCTLDYAPDLDFTLEADYVGFSSVALGGTFFKVFLDFETTGSGVDLTLTDSTDVGAGNLLPASFVSGTFNGDATTGLTVSVIYDAGAGTTFGDPTVFGILQIDAGATYGNLFDSGGSSFFALNLSSFFDHSPTVDSIIATVVDTGVLPSFTAEGQGQVFRVASGEFVPEPGTLTLMIAALGGLAFAGRKRQR